MIQEIAAAYNSALHRYFQFEIHQNKGTQPPLSLLITNRSSRPFKHLRLCIRSAKISQNAGFSTSTLLVRDMEFVRDFDELTLDFFTATNARLLILPRVNDNQFLAQAGKLITWGPYPITWGDRHDIQLTFLGDNIRERKPKIYTFIPRSTDDLELVEA